MIALDYQRLTKLICTDVVSAYMEDDLVMDVSGSWVRRAKTSAAAQLEQFSDAAEELYLTQHYGNAKPRRLTIYDAKDVYNQPKFNSNWTL